MDKVTRQFSQTTTFLKRKESRSGIEPMPFRLPAYRLTARILTSYHLQSVTLGRITQSKFFYTSSKQVTESQFSSVQFKMVSMRSEKPIIMRSDPSLRSFPKCCLSNGSNVPDDGPLSSFQRRSSSASLDHKCV